MSYERREEQDMNSGGRRGWRRESDRGDISQEQPRRSESSSERPSIRGEIEHHEGRSRQEHDHRPGFEPGSYREGRGSRTAADPPLSFSRPAAYPSSAQQLDGSGPHAIQSLLPPGFHEPIHSTSEPRQHLTDTKGSRFNLPDDSQRRAPPTQYQQEVGGSSSALSHAEAQQGSRSSTSRPHHTYEQGVGRDWNEERGPYDKRRSTGGSGRETGQPRVHRGAGGGHHTSNSASSSALPTTQRGAGGETGSQGARYQGYHSRSQPSSSTAASPLPFVSQETRMQLRLKSEKEDYSKHKKHAEIAPLSHGDPIYVLANHFKMNLNPKVARMLQRYHVEVVTVKEHVTAAAEAPGTGRNDLKALKHSLKRKVVSLWMSTFHPEVREGQWSFDGDKILWTTNQSPLHLETRTDSSTSGLVRPQLSEAGSSQEGLYSPLIHESNIVVLGKSRYQVKMTREGSLDLFNALSAINDATEASKRAELMQVLDIVLRHSLACLPGAIMKGTAVYLPPPPGQPALRDMDRNKFKIGLGALAWRGFRACMNLTASEALTLTMDTSMTAVIEEQNLCTYVAALLGFEDGRGSPEQISEDAIRMRKNVERDVKGLEVEMRPRDGLTRLRRIKLCSLSELTARTYKFAWKQDQGRETSIEEYYFQRYGIQLRYPKLPVVQCRPKSSDYVPMELLTVLFQPMVKRPSPVQNSKLISASAFKPEEKIPFIIDSLRNKSKLLQSETFKEFGLSVDAPDTGRDSLLRVPARQMHPPKLVASGGNTSIEIKGLTGQHNLRRGTTFYKAQEIRSWAVMSTLPRMIVEEEYVFENKTRKSPGVSADNTLTSFLREGLIPALEEAGMKVPVNPRTSSKMPTVVYADDEMMENMIEPWSSTEGLTNIRLKATKEYKKSPDFLLVLLENKCNLYNKIKKTCAKEGIITQCFTREKSKLGQGGGSNPNARRNYCTNLVLKINAKLGGVNFALHGGGSNVPIDQRLALWRPEPFRGKRVCILGVDVNHDSESQPSVAAVVASMDDACARYVSEAIEQRSARREIVDDMEAVVEKLLDKYQRENNQQYPEIVVMMRDGISEGQVPEMLEREVAGVKKACWGKTKRDIPLVVMTLQKRHNTRIFAAPKDRDGKLNYGNVLPGTVVHGLGSPTFPLDFLLVSHSGSLGTMRGVRHVKVVDEIGLTPDEVHRLCYDLCYLCCRCTRSVSVCAPVFYADLAAKKARALMYRDEYYDDRSSTASGASSDTVQISPTLRFAEVEKELVWKMHFV